MIITICGQEGSGKGTLGKGLSQRLGYKYYSMGDIRREYALKKGITLEQLNESRKSDITSDVMVDQYQAKLGQTKDNIIVDSRLGFHFIPHSIKILIVADIAVCAKRAWADIQAGLRPSEQYHSVEELEASFRRRFASDKRFYLEHYGVDHADKSRFDLVIDSTHTTKEEKLALALDWLKNNKHIPA